MRCARGLFWRTAIGGIFLVVTVLTAGTRAIPQAVDQESGAEPLEAVIEIDEVAPGARGGWDIATRMQEFSEIFRLTEGNWWDGPGAVTLAVATGKPAPRGPRRGDQRRAIRRAHS